VKTRTHLRVGTATSIVISSGVVLVHVDSRWVIQEEKTRQKPIALSRVTWSTSRCDLSRRPPIRQSPFCQGATKPFIFTMPKPQAVTMNTDEAMRASLRDAIPASQLLSQDDAGMYRSMGVDPPKNSKPPPYGGRPKFVKFIAGDKGENLPHVFLWRCAPKFWWSYFEVTHTLQIHALWRRSLDLEERCTLGEFIL